MDWHFRYLARQVKSIYMSNHLYLVLQFCIYLKLYMTGQNAVDLSMLVNFN
jgi:hypothetical protein